MSPRTNTIENSVVVITGASSGIGRASALKFAEAGAHVVVAARRGRALDDVASECRKLGVKALAVATDTSNEEQVQQLAEKALKKFRRIDVWVNNAAVGLFGPFEKVPSDLFRRAIDVNLLGYIWGARQAIRQFRKQGHGVLIEVISQGAHTPLAQASAYIAPKWGIRGLDACLREELKGTDIHVCSVYPASIDTPFYQHAANFTGKTPQTLTPSYTAEEVADVLVQLAQKPQRVKFVGTSAVVWSAIQALFPGTYESIMGAGGWKGHFEDKPAKPSSGALLKPMAGTDTISGGWKQRKRRKFLKPAIGAAAATGLLLWISNRQSSRGFFSRAA
jgi:short-subunit dehydrogenase